MDIFTQVRHEASTGAFSAGSARAISAQPVSRYISADLLLSVPPSIRSFYFRFSPVEHDSSGSYQAEPSSASSRSGLAAAESGCPLAVTAAAGR